MLCSSSFVSGFLALYRFIPPSFLFFGLFCLFCFVVVLLITVSEDEMLLALPAVPLPTAQRPPLRQLLRGRYAEGARGGRAGRERGTAAGGAPGARARGQAAVPGRGLVTERAGGRRKRAAERGAVHRCRRTPP